MAPQTTQFSYDFYKPDKPTDLIYQVDAHYPSETPSSASPKPTTWTSLSSGAPGESSTPKPSPFGHAADFTTTIQFIIRPNNTAPQADGLAFFIVPAGHNFPSQIGGNLGLFEPSASKTSHVKPSAKAQVPISFVGKELTLKFSPPAFKSGSPPPPVFTSQFTTSTLGFHFYHPVMARISLSRVAQSPSTSSVCVMCLCGDNKD
ncbi:hypothetical protein SASPL_131866 [Salvia splendens]|uniref:Legume lectin domain-containing protein n=1 Tax=Salvia splendens TaxID=180675 RepID=A0A8X8XBV7_SALSN|nr:hypothetical protein SASPL_131866 [Salvia splendens]